MPAVQHLLAFARPLSSRRRSLRAPFRPSQDPAAVYRLPRDVHDHLVTRLAPFRNRAAALSLAVFLARFHSVPGRVALAFVIDRRELAEHHALDLTEARVRGAIKALEAIGFLDRALPSGSTHKPTPEGLHRKPIKFVFGSDFALLFVAANDRAAAARRRQGTGRRTLGPDSAQRSPTGLKIPPVVSSPKSKSVADPLVNLGELRTEIGIPPKPFVPDPKLEAALERLKIGIRLSRGLGQGSAT